jgi:hypothetical protein
MGPQHAMQSFEMRFLSGLLGRWRLRDVGTAHGGLAHGQAVPLLPTPAQPLGIQDAGASAATTFIFLHKQTRLVWLE